MITALCAIATNFVSLYFLAPTLGVRGIALSGSVAVVVNVVLNHILLAKIGEKIITAADILEFLKTVFASLVMGAAVWLVYSKQDLGVLAGTVLSVLTGIVVYGVLCVVLLQKDMAEFFKKITGGRKND